jgi:pilus assembly protein Flp/PilA
VARRITTPATLATARVMIEAVDLASGFCTMPIAEIAKRACCTPRSVTKARAVLCESGLWIAGPSGVFVPCPNGNTSGLNRNQRPEKTQRKRFRGNTEVPSLYHLVPSDPVGTGPFPSLLVPFDFRGGPFCSAVSLIGLTDALRRAAYKTVMLAKFRAFLRDESGATAIEYGLIAAGISVAIIAVVNNLGTKLHTTFSSISTQLK